MPIMNDMVNEPSQESGSCEGNMLAVPRAVVSKRNSEQQIAKYAQMIAAKLVNVRFSGLTDVRTVSDDLSSSDSSSDCFSRDPDQTLHISKMDERELNKIIRASIAQFVANPPPSVSEEGEEEYDAEKAALWQK